ncbi:MAG: mycothiol synthase [Myxococcota bacterium]|jgi:mycothiol synthase
MPDDPAPKLMMRWPAAASQAVSSHVLVAGYRLDTAERWDDFVGVQAAIGFTVRGEHLAALREDLVGGAMVFCRHVATNAPVAVAVAERRAVGAAEIAWVAVAPAHRGQGLARSVTAAVTTQALRAGHAHVYLSTQATRLAALKTYLQVGFEPVCEPRSSALWATVLATLGWGSD